MWPEKQALGQTAKVSPAAARVGFGVASPTRHRIGRFGARQEEIGMTVKTISPLEAQRLVTAGAVLVDIRQPHEIDREKIEDAIAMPLTTFRDADLTPALGRKAIFFCHSGGRTTMYAGQIEAKSAGVCDPYVMSGGILAWRRAGLPTVSGPRPPGLLAKLFGR